MNNLTEEMKAKGFMTYLDFQDSLTDDEKDGKTTLFFEVVKPEDMYQKGYAEWVYSDWDTVAWDYHGREVGFLYRRLIPATPNTGMIAVDKVKFEAFKTGVVKALTAFKFARFDTQDEWRIADTELGNLIQALKNMEGNHE